MSRVVSAGVDVGSTISLTINASNFSTVLTSVQSLDLFIHPNIAEALP